MRTLSFIVNELTIEQDPNCDFEGLIPGTEGYLKAGFSFSTTWDGFVKVASFTFADKEYAVALDESDTCAIPIEVSKREKFNINVFGKKDGVIIKTNKILVVQNGGE